MRILYLVPDLFGPPSGIARYCRMVCGALSDPKNDVTAIALLDQDETRREAGQTFPGLKYLPCRGRRSLFVQRVLRAARTRPDFILVGHTNFALLGWLIAKLCRAPLVTFIYGIEVWEPLAISRRRALCASDLVISISRFTAEQATQFNGLPPESTRLLPNCVDPALLSNLEKSPKDHDIKTLSLLTVARILNSEKYKGHDQVIRALPRLLKRFPHLVYDVVGGGDGRADVEALAASEGVAHAVRFHGVVSDEEMSRFYANADVFIMPSRREGFGFVFIEAMIQGLPAIGGNVDATPEVIVDGKTGFIVNPTSQDEIVEATGRLLGDEALRARMGQAAIAHVQAEFNFDKFKKTLLDYLSELKLVRAK